MNPEQHESKGYLRRLLSGSFFSIINLLIGVTLSFFMAPIMMHTLGERHYGIWTLAASFTGWYALLDLGINQAVSRFFTKSFSTADRENCNIFASTGFALFFLLGVIGFCCSLGIGLGAYRLFPNVEDIDLLSLVIIMFGVSFALDFILRAFYGVTTGSMRHDMVGVANITFRVAGALTTYLILIQGGRLIALGIGNIVLMVIQVYVYYLLAKKAYPPLQITWNNVRKSHVKSLFGYSVFGFIAQIGDIIIYGIDNQVIAGVISLNAVAHYAIAMTLVNNYKGLLMSTSSWMVTWLTLLDALGEREKLVTSMFFGYRFGAYLSGFITFGLIFWSEPFITRWMGPAFLDAVPPLIALVFAATIQAVQEPNIRFLYATSNHRYFALSNILEGLLNLEISLILAPQLGMVGVAIGTLIACIITRGILLPIFVCRLLNINLFIYYLRISWYLLRVCVALVLPWMITEWLVGPNYPRLFLVGGLSAVCYFPIIYYIGLSKSDRQMIREFLFKK